MTGTLYKLVGEKNRLDKTSYLTNATNITGVVIKFPSSIIDPILTLNGTAIANLWQFNYIRLDEFDRYYFIDDIISIANNLWEVHCHVDVLMSWKDEIKTNNALFVRSSNPKYKTYNDPANSLTHDFKFDVYYDKYLPNMGEGTGTGSYIALISSNSGYSSSPAKPQSSRPYYQIADSASQFAIVGGGVYILTFEDINAMLNEYGGDSNVMSAVLAIYAYPFSVTQVLNGIQGQISNITEQVDFKLGSNIVHAGEDTARKVIRLRDNVILSENGKLMMVGETINIPVPSTYLDYEPYSEYYIHIPYYGDVEVKAEDLFGNDFIAGGNLNYKAITYQWAFDITKGKLKFAFYNEFTDDPNTLAPGNVLPFVNIDVQVGTQLIVTYNNQQIINRQENTLATEYYSSMIGSIVTTALGALIGIATGGVGFAFGAVSAGIMGAIRTTNLGTQLKNINKASVGATGGNMSGTYFSDPKLRIFKKTYTPTIEIDTDFVENFGYACFEDDVIESRTGYAEILMCHLDNVPALSQELDEITQLLQSGILI